MEIQEHPHPFLSAFCPIEYLKTSHTKPNQKYWTLLVPSVNPKTHNNLMASSKVYCMSEMATAASDLSTDSVSSSSSETSWKRESFTVWMKSLVMQGNGCTVFNENGAVVYRMDNYDTKSSKKVYLMDRQGKLLFTILKKVKTKQNSSLKISYKPVYNQPYQIITF